MGAFVNDGIEKIKSFCIGIDPDVFFGRFRVIFRQPVVARYHRTNQSPVFTVDLYSFGVDIRHLDFHRNEAGQSVQQHSTADYRLLGELATVFLRQGFMIDSAAGVHTENTSVSIGVVPRPGFTM